MINKSLLGGKWKHTPIGCGIKMKDSPSNGCKERNFIILIQYLDNVYKIMNRPRKKYFKILLKISEI